jgi:DNA repair protein RecN (Recombination protein N)
VCVENFLLFEKQSVVLKPAPHICAFLGDAGAGKSLLMRALEWCLNLEAPGKASNSWVRPHANDCSVELTFYLSKTHPVWDILYGTEDGHFLDEPLPLQDSEEDTDANIPFVVSRLLGKQKQKWVSQWRIQGVQVAQTLVERVRPLLVLSLGQHAQVALLDPEVQLGWLDRLGGDALNQEKCAYEVAHKTLVQAHRDYKKLEAQLREAYREQPFWTQQLEEIQTASLQDAQEDTTLEHTLQKHQSSQEAQNLLETLNQLMLGSSGLGHQEGILSLMHTWVRDFERIVKTLKLPDEVRQTVLAQWDTTQEGLNWLTQWGEEAQRQYHECLSSHEEETLRLRLSTLKSLKRKYGASLEEVSYYAETLQKKLSSLESLEQAKLAQKNYFHDQWTLVQAHEAKLWTLRTQAGEHLEAFMAKHLSELALAHARFDLSFERYAPEVLLAEASPPDKLPRFKPHKLTMRFASGEGLPLQPLQEGASGGELTRVVLLLLGSWTSSPSKQAFATAPVLLLDEVDTGTSGESAAAIANYIMRLGRWHHIWLVTHQLGVAAIAHEIYWVEKHHPSTEKTDASALRRKTPYSLLRHTALLEDKLKALTEMVTLGGTLPTAPTAAEATHASETEPFADELFHYVRALYQSYHPDAFDLTDTP